MGWWCTTVLWNIRIWCTVRMNRAIKQDEWSLFKLFSDTRHRLKLFRILVIIESPDDQIRCSKKTKRKPIHWLDWLQTAEFLFSSIFSSSKSFKDPHLNLLGWTSLRNIESIEPNHDTILCGLFFFNFQNVPTPDCFGSFRNVPLKRTDWLPALFFPLLFLL